MASAEQRYIDIISGERRGLIADVARGLLRVAEVPYSAAMRLRNSAYDAGVLRTHKLGRPCISVGNLTAGGTGKTPVVLWLAQKLVDRGARPAVLMRGYRKAGSATSDEQRMLQSALPSLAVIANPDRVAGAREALQENGAITHFILDDGFQHRRARRDFDLLLINARAPFGFEHVHPRGLLRESLPGLSRADAVLVTHATEIPPHQLERLESEIHRYTRAPIFRCDHVSDEIVSTDSLHRLPVAQLNQVPFVLFTGIGHPQSLSQQMRVLGGFRGERIYPDHHDYTRADLDELSSLAKRSGATALVTTDKDWAKLQPMWNSDMPMLYRLGLQLHFAEKQETELLTMIDRVLHERA